MTDRWSVPRLSCPFNDSISAHADAADRHTVSWASEFGLPRNGAEVARLAGTHVGRLAARTTPRASASAVEFLADWQTWLFLFDDYYSDESAAGADTAELSLVIAGFVPVLDGDRGEVRPGERGHRAALADLMDRLAVLASGPQVSRFVSAVRGYFLAQFWEAGRRAAGRPAGLAEYQAMRRHSGAVPTCLALIDMADGFFLPATQHCRADVRAVTDMAVNVTCWANDILSYPKESARSLQVHSLPAVLAAERDLSLPEALTAAVAIHDQEVARYLEAEDALRRSAGHELVRYLDGLRSWMGGNFHWSLETGRYQVMC
jgi:Terpene synthase family 2, C-terminal metal binding